MVARDFLVSVEIRDLLVLVEGRDLLVMVVIVPHRGHIPVLAHGLLPLASRPHPQLGIHREEILVTTHFYPRDLGRSLN